MKKILLGTTGLVAVALLATAASADTPKVTLGGFSDFQAGYTSDDKDANRRDADFRNDNEITVKVDGKTDGGLMYGAQIDLEADTTDDVDNQGTNAARTFTYLSGNWGRVEMGDVNSAAGNMRVDASTLAAATGGINGSWNYFVNSQGDRGNAQFITMSKLVVEHGSTTVDGDESNYNSTKFSYYTPKFSGFQAGVTYTPTINRGQSVDKQDNNGGFENIWNLALGYEGTFSNVKLAAAATYEMADLESGFAIANAEDVSAWNIGGLVGYQGFSVAASYGDWDDSALASGVDSNDYWTLGAGYTAGPIGVSATYIDSTRQSAAAVENEFTNLVLGAEYKLAAGLTPYAEVSFYDFDSQGATYDNQGTAIILGTQVAF